MAERKYSVTEIDKMRDALASIRSYDNYFVGGVEDQLRTYMLNGTDPKELDELVERKRVEHIERQRP